MYYQVISQCTQSLKYLETCLDKAEQHAAAKRFEVGVLITSRLAPDMQHFICQVQSACDYVKSAAAWLSGRTPPKHEDNEQTIDEVRARIRKTVAFEESAKEEQYAGASERKVKLSWAPGMVVGGEDYLLQMTIPNIFFHIAMGYAILRHNGVDVGKMDFLGPINLVDDVKSVQVRHHSMPQDYWLSGFNFNVEAWDEKGLTSGDLSHARPGSRSVQGCDRGEARRPVHDPQPDSRRAAAPGGRLGECEARRLGVHTQRGNGGCREGVTV